MSIKNSLRRTVFAAFTGLSLAGLAAGAALLVAIPTSAQAQVSDEFQAALDPYGVWQHPRWGLVWVPDDRPRGWQPYTVGHWVYTDDWGWFWVSDDDEADWGWVTYHYGRWIHDRGSWFWVPGDEWAPAWVNWRRGDTVVGWAPLPPDDVIYEYDDNPDTWVFVEPRFMAAPRLRGYYMPPQRREFVLRSTVMVNRSFSANRQGVRIAVNPGISPALIGAASRSAVPTFRVRPRVLASTQGVSGGVAVRPQDLRTRGAPRVPNAAPAITVQKTTTLIQPATSVSKPQALGKDERGRLGTHPPRAAQGATPQLQQQQAPGSPAPAGSPPRPSGPSPSTASPPPPPPPPGAGAPPPAAGAPPRQEPPRPPAPREEHRDERPPGAAAPAIRQGEPPPQARPDRPATPQTPPPPPPAQNRQAPPPPPPVVHQPPPPPPPAVHAPPPPPPPAARPPAPPPPPVVRAPPPPPPPAAKPAAPPPKPGEKPPEPPK